MPRWHAHDVIVIGTGGMGGAAALHLARRGVRVLGLDRFPVPHNRGSSHGQTRLIRLAYYEHPDYVPLLRRAYGLWHDLEREAGRRLLVESGLVMAGPAAGAVIAGALASARTHGLAVERLTAAEVTARWPAVRVPEAWDVVHESTAGYLHVEECVRAHAAAATRAGAELRSGLTVHGWRVAGDGVVVETDAGRFTAARLVLCPGAWAAGVLQLPAVPLPVLRKSLFWYAASPGHEAEHAAGRLPCFAFDTAAGFFYGCPALDGRGVKVANHSGGRTVADPLDLDRAVDAGEQRQIERWLGDHLPGVSRTLTAHAACLYTMSPDQHFVLGLHPAHPQVAIAAGFSGHGFKFASVVGEILADLATTGRTSHPIGFLSPGRFSDRRS
jgi:monomeric sarcosine oxidase